MTTPLDEAIRKERSMTRKSQIGGILEIIAGSLAVLGGLLFIAITPAIKEYINENPGEYYQYVDFLGVFYVISGVIGIILGALGIAGGALAITRKSFGMALTGAIAGILTFFPLGIAATILVAMGKDEFNKPAPPPVPPSTPQPPLFPPAA
jgi:hypothetical protein